MLTRHPAAWEGPEVMTVPSVEPGARRTRHRRYAPDWARIAVVAAAVFLIVAVAAAGATVVLLNRIHNGGLISTDQFPEPKNGERVNVLVMGLDSVIEADGTVVKTQEFEHRRSDVMMLVSADPVTKKVSIISIPRDTRVQIPGHGMDKINAAHAYGGPALAMQTVEDFLGVPVHYYVRTSFDGLAKLVDLIGGVEYTVEKPMKYSDPAQGLFINLQPGKQILDGSKAVQYVRYRSDSDDITRIGRQQKFLRAVINQTLSIGNVLRIPGIVSEMTKYIDTNLDAGDILRYAKLAVGLNDSDLAMDTIPGTGPYINGISYWVPDEKATQALVNRLIKGIDPEANAKIKIEVLNGTATSGKASKLAEELRKDGFTVTSVGNADKKDYKQTTVIDHRGNSDSVDALGKSLRQLLAKPGFKRALDEKAQADFTVIVGTDFSS